MAMTEEERKERKRQQKAAYRDRNREKINAIALAKYHANPERQAASTKRYSERKRREKGIPPRKVGRDIEKARERCRLYMERKRREAGVPIKGGKSEEEVKKRRDELREIRRLNNPDNFRDYNRAHMTKSRLAKTIGVPIADVPEKLLEVQLMVNEVKRKVKELKS